jgi:hypothetical protein
VEAHLIATLVPDQDDERPVVSLNAIIDQRWYTRVELLPHIALAWETACTSAKTLECKMGEGADGERKIM